MNLLQSFMGCMYPGIIRTDSIESMDQYPEDGRFQVSNIDDDGNIVSTGELQVTDRDLIYYRPSKFPTRWPLGFIRRHGIDKEQRNKFIFESGRRCTTGEAIFAFRLANEVQAAELYSRIEDKFRTIPKEGFNNHDDVETENHTHARQCSPQQTDNSFFSPNNRRSISQKFLMPGDLPSSRKDASTSTDQNDVNNSKRKAESNQSNSESDPRPLSVYTSIDFGTTEALKETARAHAASRVG